MSQQDLFMTGIEYLPVLETVLLLSLVERYENGIIQLPEFQREYVWTPFKGRKWTNRIVSKRNVHVGIVTYQILNPKTGKHDGSVFLADGRQRIETTRDFPVDPLRFGHEFGVDMAKEYVYAFPIPHSHVWYKDHTEAMHDFQDMQLGTELTPAQYHRGAITLDLIIGKDIYWTIVEVVKSTDKLMGTRYPITSDKQSKFIRDAIALFLQYISKTDRKGFWDVSVARVDRAVKGNSVEEELVKYIKDTKLTSKMLHNEIKNFENYLSMVTAEIKAVMQSYGLGGTSVSQVVIRSFYHLALYRKNTGYASISDFKNLIKAVFDSTTRTTAKKVSTGLAITQPDGTIEITSAISLSSLSPYKRIADHYGIRFFQKKRENKNRQAAMEFHRSHKNVLANMNEDDNDVVYEPALSNMSRGAKPMDQETIDRLSNTK